MLARFLHTARKNRANAMSNQGAVPARVELRVEYARGNEPGVGAPFGTGGWRGASRRVVSARHDKPLQVRIAADS